MEYRVNFPTPVPTAQQGELAARLDAEDPAAVVDWDILARVWRVSTALPAPALQALLAGGGEATNGAKIELVPSVCCGGCSG